MWHQPCQRWKYTTWVDIDKCAIIIYKRASHTCRIACEHSESTRERRIALYIKSINNRRNSRKVPVTYVLDSKSRLHVHFNRHERTVLIRLVLAVFWLNSFSRCDLDESSVRYVTSVWVRMRVVINCAAIFKVAPLHPHPPLPLHPPPTFLRP